MAADERPEVATKDTEEYAGTVMAITVEDYETSLDLQRQALELNRRSIELYEDRAERAARSNERIADALEALLELVRKSMDEPWTSPAPERICRYCGCTDDQACEGGCTWVTDDLCSSCEQRAQDAGADSLGERGYVQ